METDSYDVIVIGGGAAGLSAALVLARARRTVAVIDAGAPRNAPAAHMQGFLSRDGLPPTELLEIGRREVASYGGTLIAGAVAEAIREDERFLVRLDDGNEISGRRILVATGMTDALPDLPGLRERWARDVLHCPYCHGFEVRDRRLAVLGEDAGAVQYALIVRQWSADLTYVTSPDTLTATDRARLAARGVTVVEGSAQRVVARDDLLVGIELDDGALIACDALFVPPRFLSHNDLLVSLGCALDDGGWAVTDGGGRTSVPGVSVAGNVANPRAQVITAAGEGSAAAIALNADLVEDDVRDALRLRTEQHPD